MSLVGIIYYSLALIVLIVMVIRKDRILTIDWTKVSSFLSFMAIYTCFRLAVAKFQFSVLGIVPNTHLPDFLSDWTTFMVFWEDLVIVGSLSGLFYLISRVTKNFKAQTLLRALAIILVSAWFANGHTYQSWFAVAVISLYPYFISYWFSLRYGLGTVMVCHVLYDHITVYFQKLLPLFF